MKNKFYIFAILYFIAHLSIVGNVEADEIPSPADMDVVIQEQQIPSSNEKDVVIEENVDKQEEDVLYNNQPVSFRRKWNIDGYMFVGYGMSFAQPLDMNGVEYGALLRKFQYGFAVGGGVMVNDIYGLGISFVNMRGVDKISTNDPRFRSIQNAYYMINLDASLVIPIRFFNNRLQFYAIGGITGLFTDINQRLKEGVSIDNPGIKFSFSANVGGGIEWYMTRNLSARIEGRYTFIPTSAPVSDFFMMHFMLMLRI